MIARNFRRLALLSAALTLWAGCGTESTGPGSSSYAHDLAPGASARDFLTDVKYDHLVVEVQYVAGFRPTDAALQALGTFLNARLNKGGGIEVRLGAAIPSPGKATYSDSDIRAFEKQHRTVYTTGSTLAAWMIFLDGASADGANVLGIAYNNTSMAVFNQQIMNHTGGALGPRQDVVEATVAEHEFGHLLGLVNNGTAMLAEHQDAPNGKHCDNPNCLMYYQIESSDFISNLVGGVPPLDQHCLDDLKANGGKG